jgi:hypothetical protein
MDVPNNRIRVGVRAAQIKANIDAARDECKLLIRCAENKRPREEWNQLIRRWKEELKSLTGEDY